MPRHRIRRLALPLAMLVLTACGEPTQPPHAPADAPPAALPPTAEATPIPPPTVAPSATPVPPPTPTRVPPTATVVPVLPLRITAQLDPPAPRAGEEFVLALSIVNDGTRPARGVYVATSGPWDRWTVLDVEPSGRRRARSGAAHLCRPRGGAGRALTLGLRPTSRFFADDAVGRTRINQSVRFP